MAFTIPAGSSKTLLGVLHLAPLPGSPGAIPIDEILRRALADADVLASAGFDGFIVENFGDAPFFPEQVPPETVACMTRVACAVRAAHPHKSLGINVLRNDAASALAVAAAAGAEFIRVNVHVGVAYADQGQLQGRAYDTLRRRAALGVPVAIAADVGVKHATFPPGFDLLQSAKDTAYRGLADALIVSGRATGQSAALDDLRTVREAVPDRPLLVGSGATEKTAHALLEHADGIIVGTSIKHDMRVHAPVDPARASAFIAHARG
ncbi:MAG: BtpA/SgcQ family protein [Polyangiaceae bacterium]